MEPLQKSMSALTLENTDTAKENVLTNDEIVLKIFQYLNPPAVAALAQTNRNMQQISNDNRIWSCIAQALGFKDIQPNGAEPGAVKQEVIARSLREQIKPLPSLQVPADVSACLAQEILSIESLSFLRRWQEARDILVVWSILQGSDVDIEYKKYKNGKEMIEQVKPAFQKWMTNYQAALSTLTDLDLSNQKLVHLPNEFDKLIALKSLKLYGNNLTTLPDIIENLRALTYLELGDNKFTSFPDIICRLTTLTFLSLAGNRLDRFPDEMRNLTALTDFNLNGNKFAKLSKIIGMLTALTNLSLSSNQLTDLPVEIGTLSLDIP